MSLPACMGGWCRKRSECADYLATTRTEIAERLCPKGEEKPMQIVRYARGVAHPSAPSKELA